MITSKSKCLESFNCMQKRKKKIFSGLSKNAIYKMSLQITYLMYMYKLDFALNNQYWLICHKNQVKFMKLFIMLKKAYLLAVIKLLGMLKLLEKLKLF